MLPYAPLQYEKRYDPNTRTYKPTLNLILVDYLSGSIKDYDFDNMVKHGRLLRDPSYSSISSNQFTPLSNEILWLKNEEFDYDIEFKGLGYGSNTNSGFKVNIPKLDLHTQILGNRLAEVMSRATITNGVMSGIKWTFGRKGPTCFIEFV